MTQPNLELSLITKYQSTIHREWLNFINGEKCKIKAMPELVYLYWKLSKEAGADSIQPKNPLIANEIDFKKSKDYQILMEALENSIFALELVAQNFAYVISIALASGHICMVIGDKFLIDLTRQFHNIPGALHKIGNLGSSALVACLLQKQSITFTGAEHYCALYHCWKCSASPIVNSKNDCIGAINIASQISVKDRHSEHFSENFSRQISNEISKLEMSKYNEKLSELLQATLNTLADLNLILNQKGIILYRSKSSGLDYLLNNCKSIYDFFCQEDHQKIQELLLNPKGKLVSLKSHNRANVDGDANEAKRLNTCCFTALKLYNFATENYILLNLAPNKELFLNNTSTQVILPASNSKKQISRNKNINFNNCLDEAYCSIIINSLKRNKANISKCAKELDIARSTLYKKLKEFGISIK